MTLQFHAYPIEDGGAQIADTIGKGLQNLGNTYVDYQKAKSNAARQAMLDKFMREEQMRKMKEYAYDYETPLVSPNPTNAGPRVEPQPLLRQPGGSSLVDEWNRKMGGGAPRVPSFGGVQSNTDPYAGMSPEMARYAAIPGAKNRAEYVNAYKGIEGQALDRELKMKALEDQAENRRFMMEGREGDRDLRRLLSEMKVNEAQKKTRDDEASLTVPGFDRNPNVRASPTEVAKMRDASGEYQRLVRNVQTLQELQKKYGTFELFGPGAATMSQISEDIRLQAKNLYDLGVLNGRDYELISNIVPESKSMNAFLTRNSTRSTQYRNLGDLMGRKLDAKAESLGYRRNASDGNNDPLGLR